LHRRARHHEAESHQSSFRGPIPRVGEDELGHQVGALEGDGHPDRTAPVLTHDDEVIELEIVDEPADHLAAGMVRKG